MDAAKLRVRCEEALDYYVGDRTMIDYNIRDAIDLVTASNRTSRET